jgi:hypothetical protein
MDLNWVACAAWILSKGNDHDIDQTSSEQAARQGNVKQHSSASQHCGQRQGRGEFRGRSEVGAKCRGYRLARRSC